MQQNLSDVNQCTQREKGKHTNEDGGDMHNQHIHTTYMRRRKEPHCQVGCHNRLLAEYHGHTAHGEDIACPRQVATDFKQLWCS